MTDTHGVAASRASNVVLRRQGEPIELEWRRIRLPAELCPRRPTRQQLICAGQFPVEFRITHLRCFRFHFLGYAEACLEHSESLGSSLGLASIHKLLVADDLSDEVDRRQKGSEERQPAHLRSRLGVRDEPSEEAGDARQDERFDFDGQVNAETSLNTLDEASSERNGDSRRPCFSGFHSSPITWELPESVRRGII